MNPIATVLRTALCGAVAVAVTTATACGGGPKGSEARSAGTLTIPLLTRVGDNTYRLRATYSISGAQGVITLSADDDERVLSTTLPTGSYEASLESFTLAKDDGSGTFHDVAATVVADTQAFTIFAHSTTTISFQFVTDGVTVPSSAGNLDIGFGVTELPATCTVFGADCPLGYWCAPPALTGEALACLPAGTLPIGAACTSPAECAASSTCYDSGGGPVCVALCAPDEFGDPCASGGSCVEADPTYGLCTPETACEPMTVDTEARTVETSRFFLDFSNGVGGDPEDVDVLRWKGGPNLTSNLVLDVCTSGVVSYFGNAWAPPDPQSGGLVLVGAGSKGAWQQDGASILIHSTSTGCAPSTAIPVTTRYGFGTGPSADTIEIAREFDFGSAPFNDPFRPFVPRLLLDFDQVLYPNAAATALRSDSVGSCPIGCELSDWNGSWFAYYASSGPFAGQGMIVLRSPSAPAAHLWMDFDQSSVATSANSALLLPPPGGFTGKLREQELFCFFDASSWTPAQQSSLTLPAGCTFDLTCNLPPAGAAGGTCGDGIRQSPEGCDDGNATAGDGCSVECNVEAGSVCSVGSPSVCARNSCVGLSGTECQGGDCCEAAPVSGGTFTEGPDQDDGRSFRSTVSSFSLDVYEVTVARFREFLKSYDTWRVGNPASNAGGNPHVPGSGWDSSWPLPSTAAAVKANLQQCIPVSQQTWAETGNDTLAVNCVDWYTAMAFCIWDGGRLPTEAEYEYAASGGSNDSLYPWGDTPVPTDLPDATADYASYCLGGAPGPFTCEVASILEVGSKPAGRGRYGQQDLAGSMWEWELDWWGKYPTSSQINYAKLDTGILRSVRGGSWSFNAKYLATASRSNNRPSSFYTDIGFRCARDP